VVRAPSPPFLCPFAKRFFRDKQITSELSVSLLVYHYHYSDLKSPTQAPLRSAYVKIATRPVAQPDRRALSNLGDHTTSYNITTRLTDDYTALALVASGLQ
jgi:hypothetical protein